MRLRVRARVEVRVRARARGQGQGEVGFDVAREQRTFIAWPPVMFREVRAVCSTRVMPWSPPSRMSSP